MTTIVIIPAYNEEKRIASVVAGVRASVSGAVIVVINDCSRDDTAAIARRAGAVVVSHPFNMGYGAAIQTGYKYAGDKGCDVLVQLDADGQHDPSCIPELLAPVVAGEADIAIGSRFLKRKDYKAPFFRRAGMRLFNAITSMILGQKITDSTSGYQGINRKVLNFLKEDVYPCDYPDADVLIMLHLAGFRIKEVPVTMFPNKEGRSMHSGLKPVYYIFKMFLSILVTLLRERPSRKGENKCL